jgi:hypothetical protein
MVTTFAGSDVRAWPSLTRTAHYLGVDKSTLSRRQDLHGERVGQQEVRVSPETVMRLSREYRRRVIDEVAHDLVEHARQHATDQVPAVEAEIDAFLANEPVLASGDVAQLLDLARQHLPADLYRLVEQATTGGASRGVMGED